MDLELWIFTKLILPKLRVLFSATVRCGAYLKSTCNSAANSLGFWPKNQIEQQESASTTSASWLLMKLAYFLTIQLLHIQCSTPWSGFPPMIGLHISFVKSLDARILVCRFFFLSPTSTCRWLCRAVLVANVFGKKKKELWYFYSLAVNEQALLKY